MSSAIETLTLQEVDMMPKTFQPGVLYVSNEFETASHLCCCGCGTRVVTPIGPGRWKLDRGRNGPSLTPSIGNTSQPCRSHYIILEGRVIWAPKMSDTEHLHAIAADRRAASEALTPTLSYWGRLRARFMSWIRRVLRGR